MPGSGYLIARKPREVIRQAVALVLPTRAAVASRAALGSSHIDVHQPLCGVLDQFLRDKPASSLLAITSGRSTVVLVIVLSFVIAGLNNLRLRGSAVAARRPRVALRRSTPRAAFFDTTRGGTTDMVYTAP